MQADAITRLLLAGILACLVVLVFQGLGREAPAHGGPLEEGGVGRYDVTSTRAGTPVLIRTDTVSGRVWKLELRGGRDRWIELIEPDAKPSGEHSAAEPPEAAPVAPAAPPASAPASPAAQPAPAPPAGSASEPGDASESDLDTWLEAARKTELPPDIRIWAITQLGGSGDPRSTQALVGALGDPDPRVIAAAVAAVASRRADAGVSEALASLRENPDPAVQAALGALE
jgi:hypothetical protein